MKVGHICLSGAADPATVRFVSVLEALDRLAFQQHAIVSAPATALRLRRHPYVRVGPVAKSPIMAYCLMPDVDVVHIHDSRGGPAGLLLTLTRSIPFVITVPASGSGQPGKLNRLVLNRAQARLPADQLEAGQLIEVYRRSRHFRSKLPQNSDCG